MNVLPPLFLESTTLDAQLEAYCTNAPGYQKLREEFFETMDQIFQRIDFDLYDTFEERFGAYLYRTAELYYLFGLGLRQEVLQTLGVNEP